jgi:hypothetical protein
LTSTSVRVVARSGSPSNDELLVWHAKDGLPSNAKRVAATPTAATSEWNGVLHFDVAELAPNTAYKYALSSNQTNVGRFQTAPPLGAAANFTFAAAACSDSGADHPVYSHLAASGALFLVQTGDLHYGDIATDDVALFRDQYDLIFAQPTQRAVFAAMPLSQVPDDHDFGPNNADGESASKPAAHRAYREAQPHFPLAQESADAPLFAHSYQIGRAFFVVTDLRSDKTPTLKTSGKRVLMSPWQLNWFKSTLTNASMDESIDVVFWIEGVPFIDDDPDSLLSGTWACCPEQRTDIARHVRMLSSLHGRFFAISGDAHAIMVDNGTNNGYHRDTLGDNTYGFPVFHAASLSRTPSTKGGPYSHGCVSDWNQYGVVSVTDMGLDTRDNLGRRSVCVEFTGWEWSSEDDEDADTDALPGTVRERIRFNSCDPSRDKIADLECKGAELSEVLAPYKSEVIAAIVVAILVILAIVGCVVSWRCVVARNKKKKAATQ